MRTRSREKNIPEAISSSLSFALTTLHLIPLSALLSHSMVEVLVEFLLSHILVEILLSLVEVLLSHSLMEVLQSHSMVEVLLRFCSVIV